MSTDDLALANALDRILPTHPQLVSCREFIREVYAARGLSVIQLLLDIADDDDVTLLWFLRQEFDRELGRPITDDELSLVQEAMADADAATESTVGVTDIEQQVILHLLHLAGVSP